MPAGVFGHVMKFQSDWMDICFDRVSTHMDIFIGHIFAEGYLLVLYEVGLLTNSLSAIIFIDKKSPLEAMANGGRSRIDTSRKEKTPRIYPSSPETITGRYRGLLEWHAVKFSVRKQNNLRRTLKEYRVSTEGRRSMERSNFCSSSLHEYSSEVCFSRGIHV